MVVAWMNARAAEPERRAIQPAWEELAWYPPVSADPFFVDRAQYFEERLKVNEREISGEKLAVERRWTAAKIGAIKEAAKEHRGQRLCAIEYLVQDYRRLVSAEVEVFFVGAGKIEQAPPDCAAWYVRKHLPAGAAEDLSGPLVVLARKAEMTDAIQEWGRALAGVCIPSPEPKKLTQQDRLDHFHRTRPHGFSYGPSRLT